MRLISLAEADVSGPDRRNFLKSIGVASAAAGGPATPWLKSKNLPASRQIMKHMIDQNQYFLQYLFRFISGKNGAENIAKGLPVNQLFNVDEFIEQAARSVVDHRTASNQKHMDQLTTQVKNSKFSKEDVLYALKSKPKELWTEFIEEVHGQQTALKNIDKAFDGFFTKFINELVKELGPKEFISKFVNTCLEEHGASYYQSYLQAFSRVFDKFNDFVPHELLQGDPKQLLRHLTRNGLADKKHILDAEKFSNTRDKKERQKKREEKAKKAKEEQDRDKKVEKTTDPHKEADEDKYDIMRWEDEGGRILEQRLNKRLRQLGLLT